MVRRAMGYVQNGGKNDDRLKFAERLLYGEITALIEKNEKAY